MENDNPADGGELSPGQTVVRRQPNGMEPELARRPVMPSVDVCWLPTIEAVEEEPKWTGNVGDGRHPGQGR